jgi:hypothetical protein
MSEYETQVPIWKFKMLSWDLRRLKWMLVEGSDSTVSPRAILGFRKKLMDGSGKGKDRNVASPFDGNRHLSLMLCAVPRYPPGDDLSPLRDEISKDLWVLIIDFQLLVRAESTDLAPHKGFFLPVGTCSFWRSPHSILLVFLTHRAVESPAFEDRACRRSGSTLCDHRPSRR